MARTLTAATTFGGNRRPGWPGLRPRLLSYFAVLLLLSTSGSADAALFVSLPLSLPPPFAINSTFVSPRCVDKYSCSRISMDAKECSCHRYCYVHDSCCADRVPTGDAAVAAAKLTIAPSLYTCASALLLTAGGSTTVDDLTNVYVVNQCPPGPAFNGSMISSYCSNPLNQIWNDTLSAPVTHTTTGVTYRNIYCALCNGVQPKDVAAWTYRYDCYNPSAELPTETYYGIISRRGCMASYQKPATLPPAHDCRPNLVRACAAASTPPATKLSDACSRGATQYAYDVRRQIVYRNRDCSLCSQPPPTGPLSCASWPMSYLLPMPLAVALSLDGSPSGAGVEQPPPLAPSPQSYACPATRPPTASAEELAAWLALCPDLAVATTRCAKKQQKRRK